MRNYLGILKAVHSGADLHASAAAAGDRVPQGARGHLGYVLTHLGGAQILPLLEAAVEARTELQPHLAGGHLGLLLPHVTSSHLTPPVPCLIHQAKHSAPLPCLTCTSAHQLPLQLTVKPLTCLQP